MNTDEHIQLIPSKGIQLPRKKGGYLIKLSAALYPK